MAYRFPGPQCQTKHLLAESLNSGSLALTTNFVPGPLRPQEPASVEKEWLRLREDPQPVEVMPYNGESADDRAAFARYLMDKDRGKSLLALIAMRDALTPEIRRSWYPANFTAISTSQGIFDELTCNLAYHFAKPRGKHVRQYETIAELTRAAKRYFEDHRHEALVRNGKLKFPNGSIFMPDGRIVTFFEARD